jgi:hypothetical protein
VWLPTIYSKDKWKLSKSIKRNSAGRILGTEYIKELEIKNNLHIHTIMCVEVMITYESILGIFLVGTVVTNWPHNNVPIPKKRHQSHCSKLKLAVENAILPH